MRVKRKVLKFKYTIIYTRMNEMFEYQKLLLQHMQNVQNFTDWTQSDRNRSHNYYVLLNVFSNAPIQNNPKLLHLYTANRYCVVIRKLYQQRVNVIIILPNSLRTNSNAFYVEHILTFPWCLTQIVTTMI